MNHCFKESLNSIRIKPQIIEVLNSIILQHYLIFIILAKQLPVMLQLPESKLMLELLKSELATELYYHSVDHTLDVYAAAKSLAEYENLPLIDMKLLLVAVIYHDAGYLNQRENHEHKSCEIVRSTLPQFDYSSEDIDTICNIIMATKLPQQPLSLSEQIICDADLDYLGRDDFFETGYLLYRELYAAGLIADTKSWNQLQINFLRQHHYFTETAKNLREPKKQDNLKKILSII